MTQASESHSQPIRNEFASSFSFDLRFGGAHDLLSTPNAPSLITAPQCQLLRSPPGVHRRNKITFQVYISIPYHRDPLRPSFAGPRIRYLALKRSSSAPLTKPTKSSDPLMHFDGTRREIRHWIAVDQPFSRRTTITLSRQARTLEAVSSNQDPRA